MGITIDKVDDGIWKDIENYEGIYQVCNRGEIKSLERYVTWKDRLQFVKERILKQDVNKFGYHIVTLSKNGKTKRFSVHRLVSLSFILNHENKPEVNHIDGNKTNNHYTNLEWFTSSENQIHAFKLGLQKPYGCKGEASGSSVLTEKDVLEIRNKHVPKKYGFGRLAKEYSVAKSTIQSILIRNSWKHI